MFDDLLLDNPTRLAEADSGGVLRFAAMAGSQVRAVVDAADEARLVERLDANRPRAVVLLSQPGPGRSVALLLSALLAQSCPVPLVVTEQVPSWAGPLDVVFGHVVDAGDRRLAESVAQAGRRGVTVMLSAPSDGPVAAALAGRGVLLTPRVAVPPELTFSGGFAAGVAVANQLGFLAEDVTALADHLDMEAERDHLSRDSFANPAKSLASQLAEHVPLLWGDGLTGEAVASHGAYSLATHAAQVCDVASYRQAFARPALYRAAILERHNRDIFADPELDSAASVPFRPLLFSVQRGSEAERFRSQLGDRLVDVELVAAMEETESSDAIRAAVVALRTELAAIYLGLATGRLGSGQSSVPAAW